MHSTAIGLRRKSSSFYKPLDSTTFNLSSPPPGCDLNARDDIGYTPLHLCAEHGYLDMINVLLRHNAQVNFNHPDDEDQYPIDAVDEPLRLALKVGAQGTVLGKIMYQNIFS